MIELRLLSGRIASSSAWTHSAGVGFDRAVDAPHQLVRQSEHQLHRSVHVRAVPGTGRGRRRTRRRGGADPFRRSERSHLRHQRVSLRSEPDAARIARVHWRTTRYSDFGESEAVLQDLRSYEVGGRYRHGLSRYATLRLGYIYRKGAYGFTRIDGPSVVHDIDIGIDYARALSFSRRTTLTFGWARARSTRRPTLPPSADASVSVRRPCQPGARDGSDVARGSRLQPGGWVRRDIRPAGVFRFVQHVA